MKLEKCLAEIDTMHSQDPEKINGRPAELIYAERMTGWLEKLAGNPSEQLQIAVRSQHLCRWEIPRSEYPMDRTGYFKWRTELGRLHADKAAQCMKSSGYSEDDIEKVKKIIRKQNIKGDSDVQTMEDCACLVFIENDFLEFAAKYSEERVIDIVRKTWNKMSEKGQQAALSLDLPQEALQIVQKALS